jgi:hypothetical protein
MNAAQSRPWAIATAGASGSILANDAPGLAPAGSGRLGRGVAFARRRGLGGVTASTLNNPMLVPGQIAVALAHLLAIYLYLVAVEVVSRA